MKKRNTEKKTSKNLQIHVRPETREKLERIQRERRMKLNEVADFLADEYFARQQGLQTAGA